MDLAHLHLLLNHIPLVGILIGILICIAGFILRDPSVRRIALSIFIFSAMLAIPVFLTGESAEEKVEHLPGILGSSIETHEEIASIFIWMMIALGIVALVALVTDIVKRNYAAKFVNVLAFILSLIVLVMAYQVGNTGGQIRHHEVSAATPSNLHEEQDSD